MSLAREPERGQGRDQAGGWFARLRQRIHARQTERGIDAVALKLYQTTATQARWPRLYGELYGLPDNPEGRFEAVALHCALVMRRLRREGETSKTLGQALFDTMVGDLDESCRKLGIGDLSVGGYVKRMVGNFYARAAALDRLLADTPDMAAEEELRRNIYHSVSPTPLQTERLFAYLRAQDAFLHTQNGESLQQGNVRFTTDV